ncbi:MAG: hypothetical protein LW630_08590, partial [Saprospiraceae bacterium]|nr:hypothetical protein [Saprospiraceae bacterium]
MIKYSCFFPVLSLVVIFTSLFQPGMAHVPVSGASSALRAQAAHSAGVPQGIPGQALAQQQAARPDLTAHKVLFMENAGQITDLHGQAVPEVRYLLRSQGLNVQLRTSGFSYDAWMPVYDTDPAQDSNTAEVATSAEKRTVTGYKYHRVDIAFKNGNPSPQILAMDQDEIEIQIFHQKQHLSVRNYGRIVYKNIYDGIDLEFVAGGKDGTAVEYNFIVHPGADPSLIQLEYKGADDLRLEEGLIRMDITHGTIEENIPASWQEETKQAVEVSYAMCESGTVGFAVGAYDKATTLVIDPTPRLVWGSYFQNDYGIPEVTYDNYLTLPNYTETKDNYQSNQNINSSVVDQDGNMYFAFSTKQPDWKVTSGAFQGEISKKSDIGEICECPKNGKPQWIQEGWGYDIFIAKFNNKGRLVAATYYGGTAAEYFPSLALSNDGLFLACNTNSSELEAENGHPNPGEYASVVVKLSLNLKNKIWARILGGTTPYDGYNGTDAPGAIATDPSGNVLLVTFRRDTDYPNAGGLDNGAYEGKKVFGSKLNGINGNIQWSGVLVTTDAPSEAYYLVNALKCDKQGNFFLVAQTEGDALTGVSNNFTGLGTSGSYNPVYPGSIMGSSESDIILMKIGPMGNKIWATWVGEKGEERDGRYIDLAIDGNGNPWVTFQNKSGQEVYTTTPDALYPALPENYITCDLNREDVELRYLRQYSSDGDSLLYSTIVAHESYLEEWSGNESVSLAIDTLTDEIYLGQKVSLYEGCTIGPGSVNNTTPCAHQAIYNADAGQGFYVTKYNAGAKERLWATYLGYTNGANKIELEAFDRRLYYLQEVYDFVDLQDVTTTGTEQPDWLNDSRNNDTNPGWMVGMLDEGVLPAGVTMTPSVVTPASRTACVGGLVESFTGNKVTLTGPEGYEATVLYQWQKSNSATGPWTNMAGETAKNLTPEPRDSSGTVYFRRLAQLAGEYCDKTTYDSSIVVSLTVGPNIAPKA